MKAIILSAGQGSRLGHLVDDRPKCLIEFNGRTLLDRQLDTLEANGVHEAVVVTGFHDELVEEDDGQAQRRSERCGRSSIPSTRSRTIPARSSWRARSSAGECLVWNGDTLVSKALMRRVVENGRAGICVTIDRKPSYDDDDMKVVEDGGRLKAIGKRIDRRT